MRQMQMNPTIRRACSVAASRSARYVRLLACPRVLTLLGVSLSAVFAGCDATRDADAPFVVTAVADAVVVFEGATVTLSAETEVEGATLFYRWDVNSAPTEVELSIPTGTPITVGPLTELGRYVFRVQMADEQGRVDVDFVTVEVVVPFESSVPRLIMTDEPVSLALSGIDESVDLDILWSVDGDADIADAESPVATLTARSGETLTVNLAVTAGSAGADPVVSMESFDVVAITQDLPRVTVETNFGDFTIELENDLAPLHTANFLQYVDEDFYDGLLFHRIACIEDDDTGECSPFVLQGGGFERIGGELVGREPLRDAILSEADNGLQNFETFTVSLALSGTPDTGRAQFFVNLGQNGFLDLQGFTVFGRVVDGFETLDTLNEVETEESEILDGEVSQPVEDVVIERIIRIE